MHKGIDIYFFMFGFNTHEVIYQICLPIIPFIPQFKINFISLSKIAF